MNFGYWSPDVLAKDKRSSSEKREKLLNRELDQEEPRYFKVL